MPQTELQFEVKDEEAMVDFGRRLGESVTVPLVVFLHGNLGAGKTTLTRGVLRAFDYSRPVKSPTYTLVEEYELSNVTLYHFDLYRLADPEELEFMGIRDYFREDALCFVEWPEKGCGLLPEPDLNVDIEIKGHERLVRLTSLGRQGEKVLSCLS